MKLSLQHSLHIVAWACVPLDAHLFADVRARGRERGAHVANVPRRQIRQRLALAAPLARAIDAGNRGTAPSGLVDADVHVERAHARQLHLKAEGGQARQADGHLQRSAME